MNSWTHAKIWGKHHHSNSNTVVSYWEAAEDQQGYEEVTRRASGVPNQVLNSHSRTEPQYTHLVHISGHLLVLKLLPLLILEGGRKSLLWKTTASILCHLVWEGITALPTPLNEEKGLKTFSLSHTPWPQWAKRSEMIKTPTKSRLKGMFSITSF